MKKKFKLSLFAITTVLICSWKPQPNSNQIDLKGKLFDFAEDLDKDACNLAKNGIGSTIYFISEKQFVELWTDTRNNDNDTIINKGTYKFNQIRLSLTYDSISAKLDYYKKSYNQIIWTNRKPYRQYVLLYCNDKSCFLPDDISDTDAYTAYGRQNDILPAITFKEKLKRNGVWDLLELE